MHLLSCENPKRVFNKYIGEYVWTTCGHCNTCRNAKAARWTDALERERIYHRWCLFVTLTYEDKWLPKIQLLDMESNLLNGCVEDNFFKVDPVLESNRLHDSICIPFHDLLHRNDVKYPDSPQEDIDLFFGLYKQFGGIPYFSCSDLQLYHKRLNKYFYDNVTNRFKNFRFFAVSEFGSTTLRPHAHIIYYVDDERVANAFAKAVSVCWRYGITDTQYVEKSACGYVAQYVNKHSDLPLFYKTGKLKPRYWFSKRPIIGVQDQSNTLSIVRDDSEVLQEVFDNCLVETCSRKNGHSTEYVKRPLSKSVENRLFPKCPSFKQVSDSCRIELYNIASRFQRKGFTSFERFRFEVQDYLERIYVRLDWSYRSLNTEFSDFLYEKFYKPFMSGIEKDVNAAYEWLRRLYYTSRKVLYYACLFKVNLLTYVNRIIEYYNKKELWLLSKKYGYQQVYNGSVEDLALMYPEYLLNNGFTIKEYIDFIGIPKDVKSQKEDGAFYAFSNKKNHFKNAYLDSLEFKRTYKNLFITLKTYFYAKKCYEALEAFAS